MLSHYLLSLLAIFSLMATGHGPRAEAAIYYEAQMDFSERTVPGSSYYWNKERIDGCIYKEDNVSNAYYAWTKLSVQNWRQALQEYTGNHDEWNVTARYIDSEQVGDSDSCDFVIYIYDSYKDFPGYPAQSGAYTAAESTDGVASKARVYLSPLILHGDGVTEIDLPSYAFRNSAVHEVGHVLGLGHMRSIQGFLMSPQFDYVEQKDQLPITTLELAKLESIYGSDGFD